MSATYDIAALPGEIAVRRSRAYPRHGELISIMLLALAFALGLGLLYAARSHDAAGQEAEAASLNDSKDSEKLFQALRQVIPGEEEARHARGQIIQRAAQRPYQNAGELRFLRVPAAELGAVGTTDKLIPLLTAVQFTRLKPRVRVRSGADYARLYWWCVAAFNAAFLIAHLILVWRAPNADQILIPAVMLVAGAALMLQISMRDPLRDSPSYLMFATGLLFAIPLAATLAGVNLERTTRFYIWSPLLLALALSAVLLLFGSGPAGSGTRVNLRLFGTTVQPSEWIRLLITFFLAGFLCDRAALIRNRPVRWLPPRWHGLIPHPVDVVPIAAAFLLCAGMFRGMRDLGPALMLAVAFSVCYVFARGKFLFVTAAFALSGAGIMWLLANHPAALGTAAGRIAMMASPFDNTVRGGDHLANGFWALAAGGFSGQGPGLGFTSELTNANNDFILGAIGEDLGFFGLLCVVGAAVLIVLSTIRTARL
jgi:cell division protein FtsW (lipid II flippase)